MILMLNWFSNWEMAAASPPSEKPVVQVQLPRPALPSPSVAPFFVRAPRRPSDMMMSLQAERGRGE